MGLWDVYRSRLNAQGGDRRGTAAQRERQFLGRKIPNSLSYHHVTIDGIGRDLAVIDSEDRKSVV